MKTSLIIIIIVFCINLVWAETPYQTVSTAGVTFNYRVTTDLTQLDCQLTGNTTGWVGVGFFPGQGMQGANFVIGYDTGGTVHIRDDWGTASNTHASDTSLGGSNNITLSSSSEAAGITQLNFTIPLNSGDNFDRVLAIGQTYGIILGRGQNGTDNFTGPHAEVGSAQITIVQPVANQDDYIANPAFTASAYPNPFAANISFAFQLKNGAAVSIDIYNSKGQLVNSIPKTAYQKGNNRIVWNGTNNKGKALPNGTYFCLIATEAQTTNLKLQLLR
jgi:hypothetical protein